MGRSVSTIVCIGYGLSLLGLWFYSGADSTDRMGERERDEHGQFQAEHSDDEILAAVDEFEPAATREVAESVGYKSRSAVEYRLRQLENEGRVRSKKVGRELVWMLR